jgi:hypothetical protein
MGFNTSVQQFVDVENLNGLNWSLLYFLKKSKQLDQDEIIEILDQAKPP